MERLRERLRHCERLIRTDDSAKLQKCPWHVPLQHSEADVGWLSVSFKSSECLLSPTTMPSSRRRLGLPATYMCCLPHGVL
ncbi:hypothetical protein MRX96_003392 [Rhipicephalus microplus]